MVAASFRESMIFYYRLKCKKQNSNSNMDENSINDDSNSDDDLNAHNEVSNDASTESKAEDCHSMRFMEDEDLEELINDDTSRRNSNKNDFNSSTSYLKED